MKNDYLLPIMKRSKLYHVDSRGRVWSCRGVSNSKPGTVWRELKCFGRFQIYHYGKRVIAARFIWYWFNGPIPKGHEIDHKNNVKTDNRLKNLQSITGIENRRKGVRESWATRQRGPSPTKKAATKKFWDGVPQNERRRALKGARTMTKAQRRERALKMWRARRTNKMWPQQFVQGWKTRRKNLRKKFK
jgi:hypothetical protein